MRTLEPQQEFRQPEAHPRHAKPSGSNLRDRVVIWSTVILVAAFLGFVVLYVNHEPAPREEAVATIGDPPADPERQAVRDWLRRNADDPHPRELRWWPARDLVELHRQRLKAARNSALEDDDQDGYVEQLEREGPERVCRLKYRTINEVGAQVSADDLFVIRNGRAVALRKGTARENAARRYFSDDSGTP
jgi:hypothetical protein